MGDVHKRGMKLITGTIDATPVGVLLGYSCAWSGEYHGQPDEGDFVDTAQLFTKESVNFSFQCIHTLPAVFKVPKAVSITEVMDNGSNRTIPLGSHVCTKMGMDHPEGGITTCTIEGISAGDVTAPAAA